MRVLRLLLPLLVLIAVAPATAAADVEPNDLVPQAELIPAAPWSGTGTLATDNDVDRYMIYVGTAATQVQIKLSATRTKPCVGGTTSSTCFANVDLRDAGDNTLVSDDGRVDSSSTDPRIQLALSYSIKSPGTYYVVVDGSNCCSRPIADPYTLSVDANQPLATYQPEGCEAARRELTSRNTDLVTATQNRDAAAATVTSATTALATRSAKRKTLLSKLKRTKRRSAKRRVRARYVKAKRAEAKAVAALGAANARFAAVAPLVGFQQGRVAEQDAATRGACGGSL